MSVSLADLDVEKFALVTGGTGYIGSHTVVALIEAGYQVVIIDNLDNSSEIVLSGIERITGHVPHFVHADLRDADAVIKIFKEYPIASVVHLAGLKSVGESIHSPSKYYDNNIGATLNLVKAMQTAEVTTLVFSSSATVYSSSSEPPLGEDAKKLPTNPYGMSKYIIEQVLTDMALANRKWRFGILRYFNPIGAHPSGRIGETPSGIPNNLMPYLMQVAIGKLAKLSIYGGDYETPDGTCIRDYVHVVDLARGHLAALRFLEEANGVHDWNLGTGKGTSVLELVKAVEQVIEKPIPSEIIGRRKGDMPVVFADVTKASNELSWRAEHTIEKMCVDHWNWQKRNPGWYQ